MLNIPEYKEYGGETKIALMDNSSLAFMHELSQRSYPSDGIHDHQSDPECRPPDELP